MDRKGGHSRSSKKSSGKAKRPEEGSQKLDISYLLNDSGTDERPDEAMLDAGAALGSRSHRSRQTSHASSSSNGTRTQRVAPRLTGDSRERQYTCSLCQQDFSSRAALDEQYVLYIVNFFIPAVHCASDVRTDFSPFVHTRLSP